MCRKDLEHRQRLNYLVSLRTEIAALTIVRCRMSHERIVLAADSNLPVVSSFPEATYKRIGLCDHETRKNRLGCGHTMSRYKLEEAIGELDKGANEKSDQGMLLARELGWLTNEIHLLDHRKGDAEKSLAIALEEAGGKEGSGCSGDERVEKAASEVKKIELIHDTYVDRIGNLRDSVLVEIDKLIEQISLGQDEGESLPS